MDDYIREHDVPSDYVRRDDVIDNAGNYVSVGTLICLAKDGHVSLSDLEQYIEEAVPLSAVIGISSADVRENVRGEWVGEADGYADVNPVYDMWYCSHCGYRHDDDEPPEWNFCPNCGADMRKEVQDEAG